MLLEQPVDQQARTERQGGDQENHGAAVGSPLDAAHPPQRIGRESAGEHDIGRVPEHAPERRPRRGGDANEMVVAKENARGGQVEFGREREQRHASQTEDEGEGIYRFRRHDQPLRGTTSV